MFTMYRRNIVCTRFVQRFLRFPRPQTAQNNSQKLRLKSRSLLYTYNPASKAILQKREPRSNYHIVEIMCCLCIFYDGLIISGKRLLWNLFLRSIYWFLAIIRTFVKVTKGVKCHPRTLICYQMSMIDRAEKFFNSISTAKVKYHKVATYQDLIDGMNAIGWLIE